MLFFFLLGGGCRLLPSNCLKLQSAADFRCFDLTRSHFSHCSWKLSLHGDWMLITPSWICFWNDKLSLCDASHGSWWELPFPPPPEGPSSITFYMLYLPHMVCWKLRESAFAKKNGSPPLVIKQHPKLVGYKLLLICSVCAHRTRTNCCCCLSVRSPRVTHPPQLNLIAFNSG